MAYRIYELGIIVFSNLEFILDLRTRVSSRKQLLGVFAGGSASASHHPG